MSLSPAIQRKVVELSLALFESNSVLRCQHFSFLIYKGGRIISIGKNSIKTHPTNLLNPKINYFGENIASHKGTCSELHCFLKAKNRTNVEFSKCVLVNTRLDKGRGICNSRPCQSCQSLIEYLAPGAVFYSNSGPNGWWFEEYIY